MFVFLLKTKKAGIPAFLEKNHMGAALKKL
jgi:hypothetical protein